MERGKISKAKVFSDSLFPDFIDKVNLLLNSQKYNYLSSDMQKLKEDILKDESST